MPTLPCAATASVVLHVGARPVKVAVRPDTLKIAPSAVEAARVDAKKVVVVGLYIFVLWPSY